MTPRTWLKLGLVVFISSGVAPSLINHLTHPAMAETIINYPSNSSTQDRDHEEEHHDRVDRKVTLEIVARGDAWADVYIDNRRLFSPRTLTRRRTFQVEAGVYNIRVRNANNFFDDWIDGSLEISDAEEASNTVVFSFSETGQVRLSGRYHTWSSHLDSE